MAQAYGDGKGQPMTQMAWVFLLISWSVIIGCTLYCFVKLMSSNRTLQDDDTASTENESFPMT